MDFEKVDVQKRVCVLNIVCGVDGFAWVYTHTNQPIHYTNQPTPR
jgi:hypothetical protein